MSSNITYDIFDVLLYTKPEFFNLTRQELIDKFEDYNNKIDLVNDIKHFLYGNQLKINIHNIFSFLDIHVDVNTKLNSYLIKDLVVLLDTVLPGYYSSYFWNSATINDLATNGYVHTNFLEKLELTIIKNKDSIDREDFLSFTKTNQIKLLLSLVILNRLENVMIFFKPENDFIDFSKIKPEFNNFYIYDKIVGVEKETEDSYSDLKLIKNGIDKADLINDEQARTISMSRGQSTDHYVLTARRPIKSRVILKNKILSISFWLPYKEKEIGKFSIDFEQIKSLFVCLPFEMKVNLLGRINDYKEIYNEVRLIPNIKINEGINKFIIYQNKIIRCFFDTIDQTDRKDYNIAYGKLQDIINEAEIEKSKNIFCNYEYNKVESKLQSIVKDKKNIVFFIFDLKKAFYSINIHHMSKTITSFLKDNIEKAEARIYFSILFRFIILISRAIKKDYLPITSYSQFLFKLYFLALFKNVKESNFLTFVDDFIIYGTKEEVYRTFSEIKHVLITNRFSISSFNIYDKMFSNSFSIFKKEYQFDISERPAIIEEYKKISEAENNKELMASLVIGIKNTITNESKNIYLDSKELIVYMLKDIIKNEEKIVLCDKIVNKTHCAVCYDNPKNCCLTPCGHMFCRVCINSLTNKRCPYCNLQYKECINLYDI